MIAGLDLLACHMVGDYIFQTSDMAAKKLTEWPTRLLHVLAYNLPFMVLCLLTGATGPKVGLFLLLNVVIHFIVDSRRWASGKDWAPKPILVDQSIHLVTLAALWHLFLQ